MTITIKATMNSDKRFDLEMTARTLIMRRTSKKLAELFRYTPTATTETRNDIQKILDTISKEIFKKKGRLVINKFDCYKNPSNPELNVSLNLSDIKDSKLEYIVGMLRLQGE